MIIIPPDLMSPEDIKVLRDNEICVVEARDPSKVRFVDPIPAASQRTQIANAAIKLSRMLLNANWYQHYTGNPDMLGHKDFCYLFLKCLREGTELSPNGTIQEQEAAAYSDAHFEEVRKIAREDARAEREAKKKKQAEEQAKAKQQGK